MPSCKGFLSFLSTTKELKLLRQIPIGENLFIRPTTTGTYDPPNFIKSIWIINYRVIDVDTPILTQTPALVPSTTTPVVPIIIDVPIDNSIDNMESEVAIEANDKYVSATHALVVMNPLENHSLMRFVVVVPQENLTSKTDTSIDTVTSINFVSKHFLNTYGFYIKPLQKSLS